MRSMITVHDAIDATRAIYANITSDKLKQAAAQQSGMVAKGRLLQEAGKWDDINERNKMIRAYAMYDRQNRG